MSDPTSLATYEELYVVSDLHLGGTLGAPMFAQGDRLARLIDHLRERRTAADGPLALVLNGDVIDTLAEPTHRYVAYPKEAEGILGRLFEHAEFAPIWKALRRFLETPGRRLIVVIGNHDLELAYANVQQWLRAQLCGDDTRASGRLAFETSGAGFACRVGAAEGPTADVLCLHGNEHDSWNVVRPSYMARLTRGAAYRTLSPEPERPPNAGTQLVKKVMNEVKEVYPFVDLLQPGVETVLTVLLALDATLVTRLPAILAAAMRGTVSGKKNVRSVLGEGDARADQDVPEDVALPTAWSPGPEMERFLGVSPEDGDAVVERLWEGVLRGDTVAPDPVEDAQRLDAGRAFLNAGRFVLRRVGRKPREALRRALLDWCGVQDCWNVDARDAIADRVEAVVSRNVDVVIAGHTHLRRQRRLRGGEGPLYLNTGTWARLMGLDRWMLESEAVFEQIWDAMRAGTLEALDRLRVRPSEDAEPVAVVRNQGTVAVVRPEDATVVAGLREFQLDPSEPLPAVPDTAWAEVRR